MNLLLDGPDRRSLREILVDAFDRADLTRAFAESSPSRELENLVAPGPFSDQVFALIDRAEGEGWLDELVAVLERERPERDDLLGRARAIVGRARTQAEEIGGEDLAPVVLRARFVRFAALAIAIGLVTVAAGVAAWALSPEVGVWGLPGAAVALVAALAVLAVALRAGRAARAFLLSGAPKIALLLLAAVASANAWVLLQSYRDSRQPNFILRVVDGAAPVADKRAHVRRAVAEGVDDMRVEETTNRNGEAFFRLAVGSDRVYLGGVDLDAGEICQFPAFKVREKRSLVHDLADLGCAEGPPRIAESVREETSELRVLRAKSIEGPAADPPPPEVSVLFPAVRADPEARRARAPLGLPSAPKVVDRIYYTLGYDPTFRVPRWVAFTVDSRRTLRLRRRGTWALDPDIPPELQSDPADYKNNPYDRGHLVRRTDALVADGGEARALAAQKEVYYYSVAVPQPMGTNQHTWLAVEDFTTEQSELLGPIHVMAGPIYPRAAESNLPFLVIGPGRTPVPIALFRVLLRRGGDGAWRALAFIVPNDGSREDDVKVFVRPVADVEKETGLRFFPDLPADQARRLKGAADLDRFLAGGPEDRR